MSIEVYRAIRERRLRELQKELKRLETENLPPSRRGKRNGGKGDEEGSKESPGGKGDA